MTLGEKEMYVNTEGLQNNYSFSVAPEAVVHRIELRVVPPVGAPFSHHLDVSRFHEQNCAALADGVAVVLPRASCIAVLELASRPGELVDPVLVAAAFASAAVKIDQTYTTPYQHHNPMEAHSLVADWVGNNLELHDSSQNIFAVKSTMAQAFGIPRANVHVMSPFVGGAFGSKGSTWPHVFAAAMASFQLRKPVKLWLSRKQLMSSWSAAESDLVPSRGGVAPIQRAAE